jgi:hypothetical protein
MTPTRESLRLAATLLLVGELLSLVGLLHPGREAANNHPAVFAEYAESATWTAVHFGQFASTAIIMAGLVAVFYALRLHSGGLRWVGRFAAVSAVVTLGLTAVLQAVDGVALKQAVDAWVRAPEAEKAARFATAEGVRWLEWGVRSYQRIMLGVSLLLFAALMVRTARIPAPIGYLAGLTGLAYLGQGFVVGSEGFSPNGTAVSLLALVLEPVWIIWLFVATSRLKAQSATEELRVAVSPVTTGTG